MSYDTIIRNGRWFDGTGAPSAVRHIGVRDGHVVAVSRGEIEEPFMKKALALAESS